MTSNSVFSQLFGNTGQIRKKRAELSNLSLAFASYPNGTENALLLPATATEFAHDVFTMELLKVIAYLLGLACSFCRPTLELTM